MVYNYVFRLFDQTFSNKYDVHGMIYTIYTIYEYISYTYKVNKEKETNSNYLDPIKERDTETRDLRL